MFTGIVECVGTVTALNPESGNLQIVISSAISNELKIDQSVSHNGVCLTVVEINSGNHRVTAVEETLSKSNLGLLKLGDVINLERCMKIGDRLDGHIVQGHVDQTGICIKRKETNGSWLFTFEYSPSKENLIVEKGSVCINGVSLTAFDVQGNYFSVAIIPYTYEHTQFNILQEGVQVNLEFDIIGKYVARMMMLGE